MGARIHYNDSSGNGNHGTEFGGVSYAVGGNGQALRLDGASGYIRVKNPAQLFDDELTITAYAATEKHWGQIVSKYSWNEPTRIANGFGIYVSSPDAPGGIANGNTIWGAVFDKERYDPKAQINSTINVGAT